MITHSSIPLLARRDDAAFRPLPAFQRPVDRTRVLPSRPTKLAIARRAAPVSRDRLPVALERTAERALALVGNARGFDQ